MTRPLAPGVQRLLNITDTHLFADPQALQNGVNVEARFRRVLEAMRPWAGAASALLHTGDLVHDEQKAGYERLQSALGTLDLPGLVIPGNHDIREALQAVFGHAGLRADRQMKLDDWCVIALDTLVEGQVGGHLSETELRALETTLAASEASNVLIALHHPPLAVNTVWLDAIGLDNPADLQAVLSADRRVRGIVFGHVHMAFDGDWEGIRALATPATAVEFVGGAETFTLGEGPPGFRWIDLHPDGGIETGVVQVPLG